MFGLVHLDGGTPFCSVTRPNGTEFRTRERLSGIHTSAPVHNLLPVPLGLDGAPQESWNPFGTEHELTVRRPRMSPIQRVVHVNAGE